MPWTDTARCEHGRPSQRYASDMTDWEWALFTPFLPPPRRLGRPRTTDLRDVTNVILYLVSTGCRWHMRACKTMRRLPPMSPAYHAQTLVGSPRFFMLSKSPGWANRRAPSERHPFSIPIESATATGEELGFPKN